MSFLGVAYEAAEILMSNKVIKQDMAMNYFLYSLAGLTQTMIKLDQLHACKEIYINAIERLKKERGHDPENKIYLRTEINRLCHELANLYSGKAIFNYAYYANAFTPNEWNTTLH